MENLFNFNEKLQITLTTATGVEGVLKKELLRLGIKDAPAINGSITIEGTAETVAKCNVNLRTADRVYVKITEFPCLTFDDLFDGVFSVNWEDVFPKNAKILVNGKCVKSNIFATVDSQRIVKKAIAKRLCEKHGLTRLEETGEEYQIEFRLFKNVVSILLNTSGVGLHKRGYRDLVGIAPIKETLASALVLCSDYYYKNPFCDPFCGSGTIAIETAMIALNVAPGKNRKFAFNSWRNFPKSAYKLALEEAIDNEKLSCKPIIFASDIDPKAIKLAKRHAETAGVLNVIDFSCKDVKNFTTDMSFGTIVTNPPYGERVYDKDEAEYCYKGLRKAYDKLDRWSLYLITSAKNFPAVFGKKQDKERKLFNSNKECKLYCYYSKKER